MPSPSLAEAHFPRERSAAVSLLLAMFHLATDAQTLVFSSLDSSAQECVTLPSEMEKIRVSLPTHAYGRVIVIRSPKVPVDKDIHLRLSQFY